MRFVDEATIHVASGRGGAGCVSFRREAFVPRGGPDGGDGGRGGHVILVASSQRNTLQDFRFKRTYRATPGQPGSSAHKTGRHGKDAVIYVPVGTVVKNAANQEVLHDFTQPQQTWIACQGGRGGKGNAHFATSTHQAPRFAQPGEESQTLDLILELKLLAQVGLLGRPNAGKSTLLAQVSAARPKIGDYPFTTLIPQLGVVTTPGGNTFVMADIPGLVEGAHHGKGLGDRFLKHLERTQVLVHLLDASDCFQDPEPSILNILNHYEMIRKELGKFHPDLLKKIEIVILNKVDAFLQHPSLLTKLHQELRNIIQKNRATQVFDQEPFLISAVQNQGIQPVLFLLDKILKTVQDPHGAI